MARGECFICRRFGFLECHHIFGGVNRAKSELYGLTVDLCSDCHRNGKQAVHRDAKTAQWLHEYGQRKWMAEQEATIDEFRREFGKNYLRTG